MSFTLLLPALLFMQTPTSHPVDRDLLPVAESSDYTATASHAQVIELIDRIRDTIRPRPLDRRGIHLLQRPKRPVVSLGVGDRRRAARFQSRQCREDQQRCRTCQRRTTTSNRGL